MSYSTVKRVFSSVRAIINLAINEFGLNILNPFSKVYLPSSHNVNVIRVIPSEDLSKIQSICKEEDDELRWIVSLLSDSGMRLSEALGLTKEDINLNNSIPYIRLTPHPWRRLKTKSSERYIPLVKDSLWASLRILEHNNESSFAFPRYTSLKDAMLIQLVQL